jgi:hypothetical protein
MVLATASNNELVGVNVRPFPHTPLQHVQTWVPCDYDIRVSTPTPHRRKPRAYTATELEFFSGYVVQLWREKAEINIGAVTLPNL